MVRAVLTVTPVAEQKRQGERQHSYREVQNEGFGTDGRFVLDPGRFAVNFASRRHIDDERDHGERTVARTT